MITTSKGNIAVEPRAIALVRVPPEEVVLLGLSTTLEATSATVVAVVAIEATWLHGSDDVELCV